ncbi:MAG: hypothetical protein DSZ24_07415 [Thermodesulfatator sp.]|nr:MAG: hypothetical protein DSZ24_07415 [Thermodesulfatator sp.]
MLDDWGLNQLSRGQALDLLEVIEDRYQRGSTVIVSQVPVEAWPRQVGTLAGIRRIQGIGSEGEYLQYSRNERRR